MDTCTFFGHKLSPESLYGPLKKEIINLIEIEKVKNFLVGNNGSFDLLVQRVLKELSKKYEIRYNIVLAYLPKDNLTENILMPEDFEKFPPHFNIDKRNQYMLNKSKYVICYATHYTGGAGKFVLMAKAKNKTVINLAEK